jgi:hypothetical protein
MNAQEALSIVADYVADATSFVETFDPEDLGDDARPIASGGGVDEALEVLDELVGEDTRCKLCGAPLYGRLRVHWHTLPEGE